MAPLRLFLSEDIVQDVASGWAKSHPPFLGSPKKTWFDMLYINVYSNRGSNHIVGTNEV